MTTIEERFNAAVNVIKNLPKNGPYQPSTDMMLQFYGLYKQATEGPCPKNKPPFWDVIGKAKWGGWNQCRHLTKEQAMESYVEKLKTIIETMSFTENVQNFVGCLSDLGNINLDELNMIAPGMKELAESHPNSPFNSRSNSPKHVGSSAFVNISQPLLNDRSTTMEEPNLSMKKMQLNNTGTLTKETNINGCTLYDLSVTNGTEVVDQSDDEYTDPFDVQNDINENILRHTELLKQVQRTLNCINDDIIALNQRFADLQKCMTELPQAVSKNRSIVSYSSRSCTKYLKWWPLKDISLQWFVLMLLWPFIFKRVRILLNLYFHK